MLEIVFIALVIGWAVFMMWRSEREMNNWIIARRAERYRLMVELDSEWTKRHFADELKNKTFIALIKGEK